MSDAAALLVALGAFITLAVMAFAIQSKRLEDPDKKSVIYAEQLRSECKMRPGRVQATLVRQSGNTYRELGEFDDADTAIGEVLKSFKRARIDSVVIWASSEDKYEFHRAFHDHRGRQEGKKLGGAVLRSI